MTAIDHNVLSAYASALVQSDRLIGHVSIRHGISGRIPGIEPAEGNAGYSAPRDGAAAWRERQHWARAAGIDPLALSSAHQVHGSEVISVGIDRRGIGGPLGSGSLGKADGLITSAPGVAVMTLHADCLPVILADPDLPAVGVVHAGWRGTVADVAGATVQAMERELGADRGRIVALLGPGIRACCYEVGDEVIDAWRAIAGESADRAIVQGPKKQHLDLAVANAMLLERAGILASSIDDRARCTQCNGDRWFSHRAQGALTGRFAAMAGIVPHGQEDSTTWI